MKHCDKIVVLKFLGQTPTNGPKIKFLSFYEEWKHGMFLMFWMKLYQHKITPSN